MRKGRDRRGRPGDLITSRTVIFDALATHSIVEPGDILMVIAAAPYQALPDPTWVSDPGWYQAPHIAAQCTRTGILVGFTDPWDYDIFNRAEAHNKGE